MCPLNDAAVAALEVHVAEMEARIEELNHVVAPLTEAEAEAVKALGPLLEAGDALYRAEQAEAENEHLKALLAATQKALIIEPGKTYVIEVPDYVTTEEYEHLRDTWRELTHSNAVIFADGWRVARERVEP